MLAIIRTNPDAISSDIVNATKLTIPSIVPCVIYEYRSLTEFFDYKKQKELLEERAALDPTYSGKQIFGIIVEAGMHFSGSALDVEHLYSHLSDHSLCYLPEIRNISLDRHKDTIAFSRVPVFRLFDNLELKGTIKPKINTFGAPTVIKPLYVNTIKLIWDNYIACLVVEDMELLHYETNIRPNIQVTISRSSSSSSLEECDNVQYLPVGTERPVMRMSKTPEPVRKVATNLSEIVNKRQTSSNILSFLPPPPQKQRLSRSAEVYVDTQWVSPLSITSKPYIPSGNILHRSNKKIVNYDFVHIVELHKSPIVLADKLSLILSLSQNTHCLKYDVWAKFALALMSSAKEDWNKLPYTARKGGMSSNPYYYNAIKSRTGGLNLNYLAGSLAYYCNSVLNPAKICKELCEPILFMDIDILKSLIFNIHSKITDNALRDDIRMAILSSGWKTTVLGRGLTVSSNPLNLSIDTEELNVGNVIEYGVPVKVVDINGFCMCIVRTTEYKPHPVEVLRVVEIKNSTTSSVMPILSKCLTISKYGIMWRTSLSEPWSLMLSGTPGIKDPIAGIISRVYPFMYDEIPLLMNSILINRVSPFDVYDLATGYDGKFNFIENNSEIIAVTDSGYILINIGGSQNYQIVQVQLYRLVWSSKVFIFPESPSVKDGYIIGMSEEWQNNIYHLFKIYTTDPKSPTYGIKTTQFTTK